MRTCLRSYGSRRGKTKKYKIDQSRIAGHNMNIRMKVSKAAYIMDSKQLLMHLRWFLGKQATRITKILRLC